MDKFQVAATVTKITTLTNKVIRVTVDTQELSPLESTMLFGLKDKLGYMLFAERPLKEADLKDIPEKAVEFKGDKTPSQRLRGAMYVWWEQGGKQGDWDTFYRAKMEDLISQVKEKLN